VLVTSLWNHPYGITQFQKIGEVRVLKKKGDHTSWVCEKNASPCAFDHSHTTTIKSCQNYIGLQLPRMGFEGRDG
jgi:hypothetical protein